MKHTLILIFALLIAINLNAKFNYKQYFQDRKARTEYENQNYSEAENRFQDMAIANPNIGQFHYNRGNALYRQEDYEQALREYQFALNDPDFKEKDKAYHNMGNIAYNINEYQQALELYRRALIENSDNMDARKNYEMTRMILQQNESDGGGDDQQEESENNEEQQGAGQSQPEPQQMEETDQNPDQQEAGRILDALEQPPDEKKQSGVRRGNYW